MEISKINKYADFLGAVEYPAVLFCDDGELLGINNSAKKILGGNIESITMQPDKYMLSDDFWPTLERKKSIIWHRLALVINSKDRHVTSGFVNQFSYGNKRAYMVLFELRSDVSIGSVSLERIINHLDIVALYLYKPDGEWQVRYISKNITNYGYKEESFYQGLVGLTDIVTKQDYDLIIGQFYKMANIDAEDFDMDITFVSADNKNTKKNLKCHVVKTDTGEIDGIEFLFINTEKNEETDQDRAYFLSAMNRLKSFVVVQEVTYGKPKFKYITPNAKNLGINVDALKFGYKLMSDYIHPEDRENVLVISKNAALERKNEYVCEYRVVNDNGQVIWVKCYNSITNYSEGAYTLEQYIVDINETKKLEEKVDIAKKDFENRISHILNNELENKDALELVDIERWNEILRAFASLSDLYTTVIATNGRQLTVPSGPAENMGSFYDMFEKPQYKSIIENLNNIIITNNVPVVMEMYDGMEGSMLCGAPIIINGEHVATWICCAYTEHEVKNMKAVYKVQWKLCEMFSEFAYNSQIVAKDSLRSKSMEYILENRIKREKILTGALNSMNADCDKAIDEVMSKSGENLDIDVMALYTKVESHEYKCTHLWSKGNSMSAEEYMSKWRAGSTVTDAATFKAKGYILVDEDHKAEDNAYAQLMNITGVNSFIAHPIEANDTVVGMLLMVDKKSNRKWTDEDIEFACDIANVVEGCVARIEGDGNISNINMHLIDTYNYLDVGIFIRDAETGEVLFANEPLNKRLGFDFVGKDSKILIENLHDKYKGFGVVQNPYFTERKEVSWKSYIKQFDCIMDLSEISMKWLDGRKASLVILRDVKEEKGDQ